MCFTVCAFPYILAFTTDSIEIRLVVNGNLVYTAVVPELQLAASRVSVIAITAPGRCELGAIFDSAHVYGSGLDEQNRRTSLHFNGGAAVTGV